jgi:hypothetical protein
LPYGNAKCTLRQSILESNIKIEILVLLTLFFDTRFMSRQVSLLRYLTEYCLRVVLLETSGNSESDFALHALSPVLENSASHVELKLRCFIKLYYYCWAGTESQLC